MAKSYREAARWCGIFLYICILNWPAVPAIAQMKENLPEKSYGIYGSWEVYAGDNHQNCYMRFDNIWNTIYFTFQDKNIRSWNFDKLGIGLVYWRSFGDGSLTVVNLGQKEFSLRSKIASPDGNFDYLDLSDTNSSELRSFFLELSRSHDIKIKHRRRDLQASLAGAADALSAWKKCGADLFLGENRLTEILP